MSRPLNAFIHTMSCEAQDIISLDLRPVAGETFPAFSAGAHIDLHLPNGLVRSYSLKNHPDDAQRYVIGVLKDRASRGGSRCVHDTLRVGMPIAISAPRNAFALHEEAGHSVLVAGGIGITPLLSMAKRLAGIGASVEVIYLARSARSAAFVEELQALGIALHLHFDDENAGPADLQALLAARNAPGTHYYACGPAVMLDHFTACCERLGHGERTHIERFNAVAVAAAHDAPAQYTLVLQRSRKTLEVRRDQSLLHAIRQCGVQPLTSCEEGLCGACETLVLEGIPDHRDSVLSDAERQANQRMLICVSGCKSQRLVLDL